MFLLKKKKEKRKAVSALKCFTESEIGSQIGQLKITFLAHSYQATFK